MPCVGARRERLKRIRTALRGQLDSWAILRACNARTYRSPDGTAAGPMWVHLRRVLDEADALEAAPDERRAMPGWRERAEAVAAELEALAEWARIDAG